MIQWVSAWASPDNATFPNGCHVCEVEVDPDTGQIEVEAYTVVDDVGTVLNLPIVKGQIQGGIAQGLGHALLKISRAHVYYVAEFDITKKNQVLSVFTSDLSKLYISLRGRFNRIDACWVHPGFPG